jgi:hypothetical protein
VSEAVTQAVLVVAGGVILILCALFVYAVVSPSRRLRTPHTLAIRLGRPCMYCKSTNTRRLGQESRHDDHGLALVTAYECLRCKLPFWSVERSPTGQRSR